MSIEAIEKELIEEFELFGDDWEARYEYLIDMGKELKPLNETLKTDNNLIKGCQSRVWLHSEFQNENIIFNADSDAAIPKGIVALMVRVLSNQSPQNIMDAQLTFIDKIGLKEHLSPTRANGLVSMIKQMKMDALAHQMKNK